MREAPEYAFNYTTGSDKSFLVYFSEPEQNNRLDDVIIATFGNGIQVNFPVSECLNQDFEAQIVIFDLMGRKVFETNTTQINNQIAFNGNSNIYMVSVISGGDVANVKVFIK